MILKSIPVYLLAFCFGVNVFAEDVKKEIVKEQSCSKAENVNAVENNYYNIRCFDFFAESALVGIDLFNFSPVKKTFGLQVNFLNKVIEEGGGLQLGFSNETKKYTGLQIGLVNTPLENSTSIFKGFQAGIYNKSDKLNGAQIGLWNKNSWGGLQIGLINDGRSSRFQIGLLNMNKESALFPVLPLINFSFADDQQYTKASWFSKSKKK